MARCQFVVAHVNRNDMAGDRVAAEGDARRRHAQRDQNRHCRDGLAWTVLLSSADASVSNVMAHRDGECTVGW